MPDLRRSLLQHDAELLRVIADQWGVELAGLDHRSAAAHLAEVILEVDLPAEIDALPAGEQSALNALLAAGGRLLAAPFFRRFGDIRPLGSGSLARQAPWLEPTGPAEALWYRGLLFRTFERTGLGSQEFAYLSDDVRERLPVPAAPAGPQLLPVPDPEKIEQRPPAVGLVDDCCTLLAYVQRYPVPVGPPPALPEEEMTPFLRYKEYARLRMIWALALDAGLLQAGEEVIRPHAENAPSWLQAPYPEQMARLAKSWLQSDGWNDLWHVPTLRPEPTGWQNDPRLPRQLVLNILGAIEPGTWWQVDSLPSAVKEVNPDFQRTAGEYDAWYLRDAASGEYLLGYENWDRVEGALLRFLVTGPLCWLELVDLGQDTRTGAVVAFRPTPAGRAFAQVQSVPYPSGPVQARIRVQPDATVVVPAATDRFVRFQVARLSDWEPWEVKGSQAVYHYRLTPRSLARAKETGIPLRRALTFLSGKSGQPLPESLRRAVESWEEEGVRIRVRQTTLLVVKDAEVLEALRAAPGVRPLLGEVVGPLAVTVRPGERDRLLAAVAELGYLSDVEEETNPPD